MIMQGCPRSKWQKLTFTKVVPSLGETTNMTQINNWGYMDMALWFHLSHQQHQLYNSSPWLHARDEILGTKEVTQQ